MQIDLFDYHLPKNLIAQLPSEPRDHSRLLLLDKKAGAVEDQHFYDLLDLLDQNDVLVLNETKVMPARLNGQKKTGGKVEVFLIKKIDDRFWECLVGGHGLKINDQIYFDLNLIGAITEDINGKLKKIKFNQTGDNFIKIVEQIGATPLPPYIKTADTAEIKEKYQTVFAKNKGSVAAPTAGLHFTEELLNKIKAKGTQVFTLTLHVGLGTFAPVVVEDITQHQIHSEWASISQEVAEKLNQLKKQKKNIIAVGTTAARTLEAFSTEDSLLEAGEKWVDIYIYPGYQYRFVDSLITNFHLPKSSLLFMVSALVGRENLLEAYRYAVKNKYRFFSFGDAMFISVFNQKTKKDPSLNSSPLS